jgi:TonB family protein
MSRRSRILLVAAGAMLLVAAAEAPAGDLAHAVVAPVRHTDATAPRRGVEDRLDEIRRRIQATLDYPELARFRALDGMALVRFEIGPDGRARDVRIASSSGERILDDAALRAVVGAAPLPRVVGRLEVPVRFELRER